MVAVGCCWRYHCTGFAGRTAIGKAGRKDVMIRCGVCVVWRLFVCVVVGRDPTRIEWVRD